MKDHANLYFLYPNDQKLYAELIEKRGKDSVSNDEVIDLGSLYIRMQDEESAFNLYKELLKKEPNNIKANLWYSYWYLQYRPGNEKELRWVIEIANKFIGFNSDLASVGYRIKEFAVSDINYKNSKDRISLLKKAIDICPNWSMSHECLATVYFYANLKREALKHFQLALENLLGISNSDWGPAEQDFHHYFTGHAHSKENNKGLLLKIEKLKKELEITD